MLRSACVTYSYLQVSCDLDPTDFGTYLFVLKYCGSGSNSILWDCPMKWIDRLMIFIFLFLFKHPEIRIRTKKWRIWIGWAKNLRIRRIRIWNTDLQGVLLFLLLALVHALKKIITLRDVNLFKFFLLLIYWYCN
jgi:hypothetical protein